MILSIKLSASIKDIANPSARRNQQHPPLVPRLPVTDLLHTRLDPHLGIRTPSALFTRNPGPNSSPTLVPLLVIAPRPIPALIPVNRLSSLHNPPVLRRINLPNPADLADRFRKKRKLAVDKRDYVSTVAAPNTLLKPVPVG